MNRIVLDDSTRERLRQVDEVVEVWDQSGHRLGHLVSDGLFRRLLYDWANAQISDAELQRRREQPGGKTLEDIWTRLGQG
jgi:hypothetical protein